MSDAWLSQVETIVWQIKADDPHRSRDASQPGTTTEHDQLADYVATQGLLLRDIVDDDESVGGLAYVAWRLDAPLSVHELPDVRCVPLPVRAILKHLRQRFPKLTDWEAAIDEDATWRTYCAAELRHDYSDLIDELEVALLPMRTADAARVEALVRVWGVGEPARMLGTYSLPLASQEDGTWLLVDAGIVAAGAVAPDADEMLQARQFGVCFDQPILVLPRPDIPVFFVRIARGARHDIDDLLDPDRRGDGLVRQRSDPRVHDVVADFRWASQSPPALVHAVVAAASAWWPPGEQRRDL